jgi:hypothetical protein
MPFALDPALRSEDHSVAQVRGINKPTDKAAARSTTTAAPQHKVTPSTAAARSRTTAPPQHKVTPSTAAARSRTTAAPQHKVAPSTAATVENEDSDVSEDDEDSDTSEDPSREDRALDEGSESADEVDDLMEVDQGAYIIFIFAYSYIYIQFRS